MRAFSSRAVGIIGGSLLLGLGLLFAARSCGTVDPSLSGVWHGYGTLPPVAREDPRLARNIAGVTLTLKGDGSFALVDGGLPFTGRWRRQSTLLEFEVETMMGRPVGVQPETTRRATGTFRAKVRPDGSELDFNALSGEVVILKREPPGASNAVKP